MGLLKDHLIAHYKFNENTAGDNANLVGGGDFATGDWVGDDPDPTYWRVWDETGATKEVSEVGTGEGHGGGGTGFCNFYSADTSRAWITQDNTLVVGKKYRFSVNIDTITLGSGLTVIETVHTTWTPKELRDIGENTFTFVATHTDITLRINSMFRNGTDVTIDNVSIKLCAIEDSSDNDHDGCAQQQTSDIHVAGKINGAFSFNGASDFIKVGDIEADVKSIAMWVKPDDVTAHTDYLIDLNGTDGIRIVNGTVTKIGFGSGTQIIYVDSVVTPIVTTNWHLIILTSTDGFDVNALDIGRVNGSGFFGGLADNVMLFDKVLTPFEGRYLYSSGNAGIEEVQDIIQLSRTGHSFASMQEM